MCPNQIGAAFQHLSLRGKRVMQVVQCGEMSVFEADIRERPEPLSGLQFR